MKQKSKNIYLKNTMLILAFAIVVIAAAWSIANIPLSRSHPLVLGAGGVLLVIIALHPHIGSGTGDISRDCFPLDDDARE